MTFFYDLNKRLAALATKQDAKQITEEAKAVAPKSKLAESIEVAEAGYSAKAGRAGKDLGQPGKAFSKIAKSAGERYGSKEAGERVAGAVLNKLRHPKESAEQGDVMDYLNDKLKDYDAQQTDESAFQAAIGKKKYGEKGMKALQKAGREHASDKTMDTIRNRYDKYDESQDTNPADRDAIIKQAQKDTMAKVLRQHGKTDQQIKRKIARTFKDVKEDDMEEGNAFTAALKATPKDGKFKVGGKEFTDTSSLEEGTCPSCHANPCECVEEGNAFGNAVRKAKADGIQKGETVRVGSKIYPVKEADMVGLAEKKKESRSKGTAFDKEHMDKLRKEKEAETHSRYDVQDTGYSKRYTRKAVDTDVDADDEVKSDTPKKRGRPKGADKGPERTTKGAWKHKGDRKVKESDMEGSHDHDEAGEYGAEGDYVKNELHTMVRVARDLEKHLRDNEDLPTWCIGKLSQAKGMVVSVMDYIMSEKERGAEQQVVPEVAPPGAKAERMVKHIKKSLSKDGKLSDKDKAIAYATTWKAKKAGKVEEQSTDTEDTKAERAGRKVAKDIEHDEGHKGKDDNRAEKAGKKVTKDIEYDDKKDKEEKVDETTVSGSVATASASKKSSGGYNFGGGVYESINNRVENMIAEGMSINISVDEQGKKSISVNATEQDAEALADLLKMAGLGGQSREQSCPTCSKAPCGCAEVVDENSPDYPTNTETSDDALQYSGGLNGPKSTGQTTVPVVASQLRRQVSMEESVELERNLFKTWKNYKG